MYIYIYIYGGSNWALTSLPERGVFSNLFASTFRRRDGVARHALGTPSDDCDSVRIGSLVSGSSVQLPRALNRLPESLPSTQLHLVKVLAKLLNDPALCTLLEPRSACLLLPPSCALILWLELPTPPGAW